MKPRVILHAAVSLDGRMDDPSLQGETQGLYYSCAHTLCPEAMLSGSATILRAAMPEPEDADGEPKKLHQLAVKYLVVVDGQGKIDAWGSLLRQPFWEKVIVLCSRGIGGEYLSGLDRLGIPFISVGEKRVDLAKALDILNDRFGIENIRVDSGGTLNGVLLREGLVDEVSLLVHPSLVGGTSPRSFFVAPDISAPDKVVRASLRKVESLPEGVLWLLYDVSGRVRDTSGS